MQSTNTVVVCMFFIMSGVHLGSIPVVAALAKHLKENPDERPFEGLGEETTDQRKVRIDREAKKWTDKMRKKHGGAARP
eukprot:SAG22_NODE_8020_length_690_cov_0.996616_2_plen_79_part_00